MFSEILNIKTDCIFPDPNQPRKKFSNEGMKELEQSVKEHGIIVPLIVREIGPFCYSIIAGERRFRAAKALGLETVPCISVSLKEDRAMEISLLENLQRENLNCMEEAAAYRYYLEKNGCTQEDLAVKVGKSRSAVSNVLRLLTLPSEVQEALFKGEISEGHGRALLGIENPADAVLLFRQVKKSGLSVRQTEVRAAELNAGKRAVKRKRKQNEVSDVQVRQAEDKFFEATGNMVKIQGKLTKGKIIFSYKTQRELERIYNLFEKDKNLFEKE